MSNQRVVVLTDEEIGITRRALAPTRERDNREKELLNSSYDKLGAALEHPGGITEDLARRIESALRDPAQFCARAYVEPMDSWQARAVVAALFQGEDNG